MGNRQVPHQTHHQSHSISAPGVIRTHGTEIRNLVLYPPELRGRKSTIYPIYDILASPRQLVQRFTASLFQGGALKFCRPGYSPRSSFMSTTLILPFGNDFSVIVQVLQIRSILRHSSHTELFAHGVFLSRRIEFVGAA